MIPDAEWKTSLTGLRPNQAALLPGPAEAEAKLQIFELSPRLTSHVRHKAKYFDLELLAKLGFVFTTDGKPLGPAARTLKQIVADLWVYPIAALEGHVRRGDFSQWIAADVGQTDFEGGGPGKLLSPARRRQCDVFHDPTLAADIREIEQRFRLGHVRDLTGSISAAIDSRYEISADKRV